MDIQIFPLDLKQMEWLEPISIDVGNVNSKYSYMYLAMDQYDAIIKYLPDSNNLIVFKVSLLTEKITELPLAACLKDFNKKFVRIHPQNKYWVLGIDDDAKPAGVKNTFLAIDPKSYEIQSRLVVKTNHSLCPFILDNRSFKSDVFWYLLFRRPENGDYDKRYAFVELEPSTVAWDTSRKPLPFMGDYIYSNTNGYFFPGLGTFIDLWKMNYSVVNPLDWSYENRFVITTEFSHANKTARWSLRIERQTVYIKLGKPPFYDPTTIFWLTLKRDGETFLLKLYCCNYDRSVSPVKFIFDVYQVDLQEIIQQYLNNLDKSKKFFTAEILTHAEIPIPACSSPFVQPLPKYAGTGVYCGSNLNFLYFYEEPLPETILLFPSDELLIDHKRQGA